MSTLIKPWKSLDKLEEILLIGVSDKDKQHKKPCALFDSSSESFKNMSLQNIRLDGA